MGTPLRVVIVAADDRRAEPVLDALRGGGYDPEHSRIDTRSGLRSALAHGKWDLVISDYHTPRLDGLSALAVVQQSVRQIPFILVSEPLSHETLVAVMKAGAVDCVPRDNLRRLVPVVSRELREVVHVRSARHQESALQQKVERWRRALNAARMGTWDWDIKRGKLSLSDDLEVVLGCVGTDLPSSRASYISLVQEDDRNRVERAIDDALSAGTDYQVSHRIACADGQVRWVRTAGRVYRSEGGEPVRMAGTIADITDRLESEPQHAVRAESYQALYMDAPVALYTVDMDGVLLRANRKAADAVGYSLDELLGRNVLDLHTAERAGRSKMESLLRDCLAGRDVDEEEVELQRPTGDVWVASVSMKPAFNEAGQVVACRAVLRDITERKRADEILQLSERAVDGSPDQIAVCDREYRFRRVNRAFSVANGRLANDVVGHPMEEVLGPDAFQDVVKRHFDRCLEGHDVTFEAWLSFRATGRRFVSASLTPLRASSGAVEGALLVLRDISERHRAAEAREQLEAQLRQAHKMEALGTLAGGIAHDFNNLLLAILGYGELTRDDLPDDSPLRSHVDRILAAGERAQTLVKQILAFGRQSERELVLVEAQMAVREALSFLRASLPSTIEIREVLDPHLCVILADSAQLQQVLLNLASNAAHAMRESGGVLTVTVDGVEIDSDVARHLGGIAPGPYVKIAVGDTGHGMTSDVVNRLYDPFFTTKAPGEGTGLGLSVVHGIVLSHGGALHVDTEPGAGTTFSLYFPRSEVPGRATPARGVPVGGGSERVLFVDDEEYVAVLGREILERLGYDVVAQTSSDEALAAFRAEPYAFDVIVTDQTMPHHTGLEFAREVRRIRGDIPIVLTTGYSEAVTTESLLRQNIAALVMKPYGGGELNRAVRDALSGANASSV